MKSINVVAAVICDRFPHPSAVFATARGYGPFAGLWEFPGGKIEPGETPREALVREIREELATEIAVGELFELVEYDYPDFHLSMRCYLAEVVRGSLLLVEAAEGRWLTANSLRDVEWLPADQGVIGRLEALLGEG